MYQYWFFNLNKCTKCKMLIVGRTVGERGYGNPVLFLLDFSLYLKLF